MKVKVIFLLMIIASLFSLALRSKDSKVTETQSSHIEKGNTEKRPMQPFSMVDGNQFD